MKIKLNIFSLLLLLLFISSSLKAEYWEQVTNYPSYLNGIWLDVFFLDENHGWICGQNWRILKTSDGGATWTAHNIASGFCESIQFVDTLHGLCSGPGGVFKSNDGGVTWTPIPYLNTMYEVWGCFMLNADTVYTLGQGCSVGEPRRIFRNLNGGNGAWEIYTLNNVPLPVSGITDFLSAFTDMIMYPNGTGYATSSGLLWRITNFGNDISDYQIMSRTDQYQMAWQEEICNIPGTNTFLLPYSGNDCGGMGASGGMYWSSDGYTWKKYSVYGSNMFGADLISTTQGWVVGRNASIYYSNDTGNTWTLRNCGINPNHNLDDIFFLNDSTGWVVGDGIYKYNKGNLNVEGEGKDFGIVCDSVVVYDTVWVDNHDYREGVILITPVQANVNYSIITSIYSNVLECGTFPIIVKYDPKSNYGTHNYSYEIYFYHPGDSKTYKDTIYYTGRVQQPTLVTDVDTLYFGDIPVQQSRTFGIRWSSQYIDTLMSYTTSDTLRGWTKVFFPKEGGFVVDPSKDNPLEFKVTPLDTGEYVESYLFTTSPCGLTKEIFLKFRGVSPVISSKRNYNITLQCITDTVVAVPICNVGSETLYIYDILHSEDNLEILGFGADLDTTARVLVPQACDTLYVRIMSLLGGSKSMNLNINNNDTRRATSITPYIITFNVNFQNSALDTDVVEIDFGYVCVGDSKRGYGEFSNIGGTDLSMPIPPIQVPEFEYKNAPTMASKGENISYEIVFTPSDVGNFTDTLKVKTEPCGLEYILILKGTGVENSIEISPEPLIDYVVVGVSKQEFVTIKSHSVQPITIDSAKWVTSADEIQLVTEFPIIINGNSSKDIIFTVSSSIPKIVNGTLRLYYHSACSQDTTLNIQIEFTENVLNFTDIPGEIITELKHNIACEKQDFNDTIFITNTRHYILDTITLLQNNIPVDNNAVFGITHTHILPMNVSDNSKIPFEIYFLPISDTIINLQVEVKARNSETNSISYTRLPVMLSFFEAKIEVSPSSVDFGYVEFCDTNLTKIYTFHNYGSGDNIYITHSLPDYIDISPTDFYLGKNDSLQVKIVLSPSLAENGEHNYEITATSKTCLQDLKLDCHYIKDTISILLSNNSLDFGEVWVDDIEQRTTTITNNSHFSLTIDSINITPNTYFYTLQNTPFLLLSGESKEIVLYFTADIPNAKYDANMILYASRSCSTFVSGTLSASIPNELYSVGIVWNDVITIPGDTNVILTATLLNDYSKTEATGIDLHIAMDYKLFDPIHLSISIDGKNWETLQYEFSYPDGITATINSEDAKQILNSKHEFLRLRGMTLVSMPEKTDVYFEKFIINTEKQYKVLQDTGSVRIAGYCGEGSGIRAIGFLPLFGVEMPSVIYGDALPIQCKTDAPQIISVSVANSIGQVIYSEEIALSNNKQDANIIAPSNSGCYIIIFTNGLQNITKHILYVK